VSDTKQEEMPTYMYFMGIVMYIKGECNLKFFLGKERRVKRIIQYEERQTVKMVQR
jgi:hypothetical protein